LNVCIAPSADSFCARALGTPIATPNTATAAASLLVIAIPKV
jgi:hypothetical protein